MGLTPEIAKALKSTRELIQLAKRDNSLYTDRVKAIADENNDGIFDVASLADENSVGLEDIASLADENSISIEDLATLIDDLEARVSALESKEE